MIGTAEAVSDYLRDSRKLKVGVVNMTMFRPFPADLIGDVVKGRKGVVVMERTDQPLSADLPLIREIRATVNKCIENGRADSDTRVSYPELASFCKMRDIPPLYSACFGMGSRDLQPEGIIGAVENMLPDGERKKFFYLSINFLHDKAFTPKQEIFQQKIQDGYPYIKDLAVKGSENPDLLPNARSQCAYTR